ncbi:RDD family protein [Inhella sp.]|uniref:RDD family protein n=1 Tax=Inhella sp. TaxID=1921806 RepID=UPI0035B47DA0
MSTPPPVRVRIACGIYEGLLLFGVLAGAGLLYGVLMRPSGSSSWGWGFSVFTLAVTAIYFSWFWSKGETLAMATWHLRLQRRGEAQPPRPAQALLRFAISLLAVLPALAAIGWTGLTSQKAAAWTVLLVNVLGYALLARLHPSRQFLHDLVSGTEMVTLRRTIQKRPG